MKKINIDTCIFINRGLYLSNWIQLTFIKIDLNIKDMIISNVALSQNSVMLKMNSLNFEYLNFKNLVINKKT